MNKGEDIMHPTPQPQMDMDGRFWIQPQPAVGHTTAANVRLPRKAEER